jgi:hypothetical protein
MRAPQEGRLVAFLFPSLDLIWCFLPLCRERPAVICLTAGHVQRTIRLSD